MIIIIIKNNFSSIKAFAGKSAVNTQALSISGIVAF